MTNSTHPQTAALDGRQVWDHMDDRPVRLEVPSWVYFLLLVSTSITVGIAAVLYLPWPIAVSNIASVLVALAFWRRHTYGRVASRRILPLYIFGIVVLLLQGLEAWGLGFVDHMSGWVAESVRGTEFTEAIHLSVLSIVSSCLFLVGAIGVFFHHPLGSYLAWFLFVVAIAQGVFPFVAILPAGGGIYFPGMAMGVVAVVTGSTGLRRLFSLPTIDHKEVSDA